MIVDSINIDKDLDIIHKSIDDINKAVKESYGNNESNKYSKINTQISPYRNDFLYPDKNLAGHVFFSRPMLNMQYVNIMSDTLLSYLHTEDPMDMRFAIRCLLDPNFASDPTIRDLASKSPLFDIRSPFIPILTNRLKSVSGFPDMVLETDMIDKGGYYSENMTLPIGYDNLRKTYDISCVFNDISGGVILSLFFHWFIWIDRAIRGEVTPYMKYINERKICYTGSIYRFVMDESNTRVVKWSKATGAYLINIPMGENFNYDKSNPVVLAGTNLSITFKIAGSVEYMNPIVLKEFNMLTDHFCPAIRDSMETVDISEIPHLDKPALPYMDLTTGKNRLLWRADKSSVTEDDTQEDIPYEIKYRRD